MIDAYCLIETKRSGKLRRRPGLNHGPFGVASWALELSSYIVQDSLVSPTKAQSSQELFLRRVTTVVVDVLNTILLCGTQCLGGALVLTVLVERWNAALTSAADGTTVRVMGRQEIADTKEMLNAGTIAGSSADITDIGSRQAEGVGLEAPTDASEDWEILDEMDREEDARLSQLVELNRVMNSDADVPPPQAAAASDDAVQ